MSATNAIHGIVLVGAMLIGVSSHTVVGYILGFVAAVFAGANVVGGYVVTGRMLKMFRREAGPSGTGRPEPEVESLNGHKGLQGLRGLLSRTGKA
jgi:NAD/NADP transhydrogenase alpha subunit